MRADHMASPFKAIYAIDLPGNASLRDMGLAYLPHADAIVFFLDAMRMHDPIYRKDTSRYKTITACH